MGFLSKNDAHDQIVEPDELRVCNHMVLRKDQSLKVLQVLSISLCVRAAAILENFETHALRVFLSFVVSDFDENWILGYFG